MNTTSHVNTTTVIDFLFSPFKENIVQNRAKQLVPFSFETNRWRRNPGLIFDLPNSVFYTPAMWRLSAVGSVYIYKEKICRDYSTSKQTHLLPRFLITKVLKSKAVIVISLVLLGSSLAPFKYFDTL